MSKTHNISLKLK